MLVARLRLFALLACLAIPTTGAAQITFNYDFTGPSGFGDNEFFATREEYLHAVAEAMREEYLGIVDAGFVLQIDDPWLIDILTDPSAAPEDRLRHASIHVARPACDSTNSPSPAMTAPRARACKSRRQGCRCGFSRAGRVATSRSNVLSTDLPRC